MATILVVEDDEANLRLATELLNSSGYDVVQTRSGEECLLKVSELQPELIILDIEMPGLNGLETLKILKNNDKTQSIKVLVVTALAMLGDEKIIKQAGADEYLSKPYGRQNFLDVVKKLCSEKK